MRSLRLASLGAVARLFSFARAARLSDAWRELATQPEIVRDLTYLGHLFEADIDPATGSVYEHDELTARGARKSMVLAIFARAEISHDELNHIRKEMESDDPFEQHDEYGRDGPLGADGDGTGG